MAAPLVTIAIPCFNAVDTIGRALASALAQDWDNLEILVCDDASTDGSAEVVARLAAGDQRVRLIRQEQNRGPGAARARLVEEAGGEFVCFFDDDDESLPGRIATQRARIVAYEAETGAALVVCYASGERRYPSGYAKPLVAIGTRGEVPRGEALADYLLYYRRMPGWHYGAGVPSSALMARRSTILAAGNFDPSLRRVEDVDFAIRLALKGGHFIGTAESLYVQYATGGADKSPQRNLEAEQALAERNADYLKSRGRYYYARHWPRLRYWHFRRSYGRFLMELAGLVFRHPVAVVRHLLSTGPKRLRHERRIRRGGAT
jgi:glycosyltransferase involved in cell wall biosynthesis